MTTHMNPLIDMINSINNAGDIHADSEWAGAKQGSAANTANTANVANKSAPSGIVRVIVKTHYGTKHFYPANRVAELFLRIQGGKTLSTASLRTLKAEGYEIEYRYEEVKL